MQTLSAAGMGVANYRSFDPSWSIPASFRPPPLIWRGVCLTSRIGKALSVLQDTYPKLQLTCSDLSPFYLAKARENHDYWRRMRQPNLAPQDHTKFLQTAAEKIAAPDNSYDVVSLQK